MGKVARVIYAVMYAGVGLGSFWLAYLGATEQLKRNGSVGMRTKATMATDAAWYAAHRASAWSIALAGVIFLGVGVWLLVTRPDDGATRTALLAGAAGAAVVVLIGGLQADRVARGILG